jgi:hypothetical protein
MSVNPGGFAIAVRKRGPKAQTVRLSSSPEFAVSSRRLARSDGRRPPEASGPTPPDRRVPGGWLRYVLAAGLAIIAAACAAPTGDFDRPRPSFINDTVLPMVGRELARERGEPVSYYILTDREKELRDRSYRLVMPIHRRGFLARSQTELVRTRIWPDERYRVDPTLYYRKLVRDRYRSSEARYNAMDSEIRADLALIEPFYRTVRKVCHADAARLRALGQTPGLTGEEEADAIGRVYENRRVVEWALTALHWRIESYSYALQRSRIEIPSKREESVRIALDRFVAEVDELEAAVAALNCDGGYRRHHGAGGYGGHRGAAPAAGTVVKR